MGAEDLGIGELSRQVRDVFTRLEGLARRLEDGQYVRTDLYLLYREGVNSALGSTQERLNRIESDKVDKTVHDALVARVNQLEDERKWLVRLVLGFVVLGILGAIFAVSGANPG